MLLNGFAIMIWLVFLFGPASGQLLNGNCNQDHCGLHGECVISTNSIGKKFFCRCDMGYGGAFCELPCSLKCGYGMKCLIDDTETPFCLYEDHEYVAVNLLASNCQPGFGGHNCSVAVKSAKPNPCLRDPCNGSICIPFIGGFQCICNDGFTGSYCSEGRDHCLDHQCQNGAKCINRSKDYICECPSNKIGRFCEHPSCMAMPGICNHGECINQPDGNGKEFQCRCKNGFQGEFCNQDIDECAYGNPCYNNSTCVNLIGSHRCDCLPGYTGAKCQTAKDICPYNKCKNNGTCYHTVTRKPVCVCPFGFTGANCEKPCLDGFGGVNCNIANGTAVCSRNGPRCINNGKCIDGLCYCPPSFIGDHCEFTREQFKAHDQTCEMAPCRNNATCIDVDGRMGYFCACEPGFTGDRCEIPTNMCTTTDPCVNGGKCISKDGELSCRCPPGFEGEHCESRTSCRQNPCRNGGYCEQPPNGDFFKCKCKLGFSGPFCNEKAKDFNVKLLGSFCESRNCSARAGNGICEKECNQVQCNFDGGDCSGGQIPFSKCRYDCADNFADGICNQECNSEECLYDGFDCISTVVHCPIRIRKHCAIRFADGHCDKECNISECGFDGGDCEAKNFDAMILKDIRVIINLNAKEFQAVGGKALMELSSDLNSTIRIQNDAVGPMVFNWNGNQELNRIPMHPISEDPYEQPVRKRTSLLMVVAYLEVVQFCKDECRFNSAQGVADLIGALLSKSNGGTVYGLPIAEAFVSPKVDPAHYKLSMMFMVIILIAAVVFLVLVIVFKKLKQRKNHHATFWIPPLNASGKFVQSLERLTLDDEQLEVDDYLKTLGPTPILQIAVNQDRFGPTAEQIPLHMEAAGSDPILIDLTLDNVSQIDCKYKRNVLHWLAGNCSGKNEILIPAEMLQCIDAGANVNAQDIDLNTPLMLAARARRARLVLILILKGADPSISNISERSALHVAAANRDQRMMEILLNDLRIVRDINKFDRHGMTALMIVASRVGCGKNQTAMAEMLVQRGADVNEDGFSRKSSDMYRGRIALHFAALNGCEEMILYLLACGSNINKQDENYQTPIMLAAREGHEAVVKILVERFASVTITDHYDRTAAQLAREGYHHEIAMYLETQEVNWHRENVFRQQRVLGNPPPLPRLTRKSYATSRLTPPRSDVSSASSTSTSPPPQSPSEGTSTQTGNLPPLPRRTEYPLHVSFSDDKFDYHYV